MNARICKVPSFSSLQPQLSTAYFHDCYELVMPLDGRSPLALYLSVVSHTPRWVDALMTIRNKVVAVMGLKDMGPMRGIDQSKPAHAYRVGDQAGIFKVMALHDGELILGEADKHLDVKVSVAKQDGPARTTVFVSTVVHVHNPMGRLYMFFVAPAHRIIAPATVSRLSHA